MGRAQSIGWADETINPLGWGCYGPEGTAKNPKPCNYCYAKQFSSRQLRGCKQCNDFIPHWHGEVLELLPHWKRPRKIFVQSMGDLFHPCTPMEAVYAVFDACVATPRHIYIFLTKHPENIMDYHFAWRNHQFGMNGWDPPANWWFGTTVTCQADVKRIGQLPADTANLFVSFEPLLEPVYLTYDQCEQFSWAIVGAETGKRQDKVIPPASWYDYILDAALTMDVPTYFKPNTGVYHEQFHMFPRRMTDHLDGKIDKELLL